MYQNSAALAITERIFAAGKWSDERAQAHIRFLRLIDF